MLGSQWDMGLIYFQIYFPKQKQKNIEQNEDNDKSHTNMGIE